MKLDGVVTMVDCKHAMKHLNEVKARWVVNEAVEQVAYADRIILNKVQGIDTKSYVITFLLCICGLRIQLSKCWLFL